MKNMREAENSRNKNDSVLWSLGQDCESKFFLFFFLVIFCATFILLCRFGCLSKLQCVSVNIDSFFLVDLAENSDKTLKQKNVSL